MKKHLTVILWILLLIASTIIAMQEIKIRACEKALYYYVGGSQ